MKSLSSLAVLTSAVASTAAAYSPFLVKPLTTHQPVGNNEGQTNYYHISFTVSSANGASGNSTGSCATFWGDNSWASNNAYSDGVPTGEWIACGSSEFSFQLFPYFSIGNFSLAVQQNFTDVSTNGTSQQMLANGTIHITNATSSQYACDIIASEVQYLQHAHGDCSIPANGSAFSIPVTASSLVPKCGQTDTVSATFEAAYDATATGQNVLVVGSIPELGSWDPSSAILLSATGASQAWPIYAVAVDIAAGTSFEYKYIVQDTDGSETWECCENRVGSVAAGTCGKATVGNDPDYFRGGGDPVAT